MEPSRMVQPNAERDPLNIQANHEFLDPCISGDLSALKAALNGKSPGTNIIQAMLAIAAYYKHLELVGYLTQKFSTVKISPQPILTACKTGSKGLMSLFVEKNPSILTIPHFIGTPLTAVIGAGTALDFLEFLIDSGADPNGRYCGSTSVLRFAAYRTPSVGPSCIEVISLLLRKGARLEKSEALSGAVFSARARNEKTNFLLEQGADPNTDVNGSHRPYPPLHTAVAHGDLELVNMLLEHGADPNMKARDGRTAFDFNNKSQQDIKDALKAAAGELNRNNSSS